MLVNTFCRVGLVLLLGSIAPLMSQEQENKTQENFQILSDYARSIFQSRGSHPIKRLVKKFPYDNDRSIIIEEITEIFEGVTFSYHKERELLDNVTLIKPAVPLPLSIKFGDTKESVRAKVGKPSFEKQNRIEYVNAGDGYPNLVSFHFKAGTLKRIEWDFIID